MTAQVAEEDVCSHCWISHLCPRHAAAPLRRVPPIVSCCFTKQLALDLRCRLRVEASCEEHFSNFLSFFFALLYDDLRRTFVSLAALH
jgi:hypothetical protein